MRPSKVPCSSTTNAISTGDMRSASSASSASALSWTVGAYEQASEVGLVYPRPSLMKHILGMQNSDRCVDRTTGGRLARMWTGRSRSRMTGAPDRDRPSRPPGVASSAHARNGRPAAARRRSCRVRTVRRSLRSAPSATIALTGSSATVDCRCAGRPSTRSAPTREKPATARSAEKQLREQRHRRSDTRGDHLGVGERDLLGHKFAENKREIGNTWNEEKNGHAFGDRCQHREGRQPAGQIVGQGAPLKAPASMPIRVMPI